MVSWNEVASRIKTSKTQYCSLFLWFNKVLLSTLKSR